MIKGYKMGNSEFKNKYDRSVLAEQAKNRSELFEHPSYKLEKQLANCISMGKYEKSKELLDKINDNRRAKLARNPLTSAQFSVVGSCTIFTRAAIKGGLIPEYAFTLSDLFIRELSSKKTIEAVNELEYKMLETFIDAVNDSVKSAENNKNYSSIIIKTINNIKASFMYDVSLHDLAKDVHVHPNYLSQAFKEETGRTVKEYYDNLRIKVIKKYLKYTDMSMTAIAGLFNFTSSSSFSSYFKRLTDMSPSKYRNESRYNSN